MVVELEESKQFFNGGSAYLALPSRGGVEERLNASQ